MKRAPRSTLALAAALVVGTLLFATPAAASDWIFGAGFHIGDVHFQIGYLPGHPYGAPDYYYRTRVDLGRVYYGRAHHHAGCYIRDGYYYHAAHCPLVHAYFSRYGHRHDDVIGYYAPHVRHDYRSGWYSRHHGRHPRHDYGHHVYERHRHYRDGHYGHGHHGRGHRDHGRHDRHHRGYRHR